MYGLHCKTELLFHLSTLLYMFMFGEVYAGNSIYCTINDIFECDSLLFFDNLCNFYIRFFCFVWHFPFYVSGPSVKFTD